jgi:hypothetical protein
MLLMLIIYFMAVKLNAPPSAIWPSCRSKCSLKPLKFQGEVERYFIHPIS